MAEGNLSRFKRGIVRYRLQDVPVPVLVTYDVAGCPTVWIKAVGRHGAYMALSGTGRTDIEAAFNAVRALLDYPDDLVIQLARPKMERRSGCSVVQADTRYYVAINYRGVDTTGTGVHPNSTQAFVIGLLLALNKAYAKLAAAEMVPQMPNGIPDAVLSSLVSSR